MLLFSLRLLPSCECGIYTPGAGNSDPEKAKIFTSRDLGTGLANVERSHTWGSEIQEHEKLKDYVIGNHIH